MKDKAISKLREELKAAKQKSFAKPIIDYLIKRIEDQYLAPHLQRPPQFALYEGRLERSLAPVSPDCSSAQLAQALSDYISLFDALLKGYLAGRLSPAEIERAYVQDLQKRTLLV